uniref:Immunoglobulin V-set domain-containing protein n=1 Tax=Esox lucius TaxID=8010 RepID=A0AAY5K202_ESOLU
MEKSKMMLLNYRHKAAVCVTSEVITRRGQEGGTTSIECPYDQGWETYPKSFYMGIWAHKVPVIQSNQPSPRTSNGRYSLYDDRERRVITVIISNLTLQDTDTYWCFIYGWYFDPHTEVMFTELLISFTPRTVLSETHPSTIITMVTIILHHSRGNQWNCVSNSRASTHRHAWNPR